MYYIRRAAPLLTLFVIWEGGSLVLGTDRLPHTWEVLALLVRSFSSHPMIRAQSGNTAGYAPHTWATLLHYLSGFSIGTCIGFLSALIIYQSNMVLRVIEPLVEIFRVVPPLIFIPFVLLIAGATQAAQSLIAAIYTLFSIFIYTLNGLRNINRNHSLLAEILGAGRSQIAIKIELPAVLPEVVGGLRITSALTLGVVVVGEYLGSPVGVGRVFQYALSYASVDLILVGIVWVVIIALVADMLIVLLARVILHWSSRLSWKNK